MRRTGSVSAVATLLVALAPAAASAQAEPAEEIAPYAICDSGAGQTTCQVTNKVDRDDLELSGPDDLFSPDEQEPARLICGEGQRGCVVAHESITPEDIRTVFPEAGDLHIFSAQSDADPVGSWQVTFDDTVVTCVVVGAKGRHRMEEPTRR